MSHHDATPEQIAEEIERHRAELAKMRSIPTRYTVHGQTIDNSDRIADLERRIRELSAQLEGRSVFQGPDIIV